jgi:hypothetical protein
MLGGASCSGQAKVLKGGRKMGAEVLGLSNGVVSIRIAGRLTEEDLAGMQQHTAAIIRDRGKVRILVLAEDFVGWEQDGRWDDFSMQEQNDNDIEKMAIVGDKRWEDLALIFTARDLRPFPIEYFTPGELANAQAWLAE